jgi:hypothetical protein
LHAAKYEAVYIRKLCYPLSNKEILVVQALAEHACAAGNNSTSHHFSDEEVVILMSLSPYSLLCRLRCDSPVERFLTTRLIGEMLAAAGQAEDESHRFSAITPDERLLGPMQEVALTDFTPVNSRKFLPSRVGVFKRGRWQKRERVPSA